MKENLGLYTTRNLNVGEKLEYQTIITVNIYLCTLLIILIIDQLGSNPPVIQ